MSLGIAKYTLGRGGGQNCPWENHCFRGSELPVSERWEVSRGRWVAQNLKRNEQLITGWGEDEIKSFFKLDIPVFYYQATSTVLMTGVMGKNTTEFLSALLSSWPHGREGCLCSVFCGRCNKVAKTGGLKQQLYCLRVREGSGWKSRRQQHLAPTPGYREESLICIFQLPLAPGILWPGAVLVQPLPPSSQ